MESTDDGGPNGIGGEGGLTSSGFCGLFCSISCGGGGGGKLFVSTTESFEFDRCGGDGSEFASVLSVGCSNGCICEEGVIIWALSRLEES